MTAYEMRLSDLSSDVCSSDLHRRHARDDVGAVRPRDEHATRPRAGSDRRGGMDQAHQAALRKAADGDLRMTLLLAWAITAAQVMLGLAMGCAAYRILSGPRAQDRVLGLDTISVSAMLMLLTFGVQPGRTPYFEAALLIRSEEHPYELQSTMR